MKIGLDVSVAEQTSGSGRYVHELATGIASHLGSDDSLYLYHGNCIERSNKLRLIDLPNVHHRSVSARHPHLRIQVALPSAILPDRLDVFHAPAFFAPLRLHTPMVATIHDVNWLDRKWDWWKQIGAKSYLDLTLQTKLVRRRADRIISDSEEARKRILTRMGKRGAPVVVVPLAPAPIFSTTPEPVDHSPYFLSVGVLALQKNQEGTIRALAELKSRGVSVKVIFAGRDPLGLRPRRLEPLAAKLGVGELVRFLEDVNDIQLRDLYASSVALVFPSLQEGFGLPILEAMACKTPVITSSLSSMPEVAGSAALYVDPKDHLSIAEAMSTVLLNPKTRARLIRAGVERVANFSWDKTAEQMISVYRDVARSK